MKKKLLAVCIAVGTIIVSAVSYQMVKSGY